MKLAEIYIRAAHSGDAAFDSIAVKLEYDVIELTKQIYVRGVNVDFVLQEGSLIERAKVIGKPIALAVGIVAGYHELRESVIDIYHDAQKFGQIAKEQFLKITHTDESAVQYKRTIPPDVTRLYRIVQNTDKLQGTELNSTSRTFYTSRVISDVARLALSNPQDEGIQNLLDNLPKKKIPELPNTVAQAIQIVQRRRMAEGRVLYDKSVGHSEPPVSYRRPLRRYARVTRL